jgi:hypothetical protein
MESTIVVRTSDLTQEPDQEARVRLVLRTMMSAYTPRDECLEEYNQIAVTAEAKISEFLETQKSLARAEGLTPGEGLPPHIGVSIALPDARRKGSVGSVFPHQPVSV